MNEQPNNPQDQPKPEETFSSPPDNQSVEDGLTPEMLPDEFEPPTNPAAYGSTDAAPSQSTEAPVSASTSSWSQPGQLDTPGSGQAGPDNTGNPAVPLADVPPSNPPTPAPQPKKSHWRGLVIGIVIALAIILGGSYAAYAVWYSQPDKVLSDAVRNLVAADTVKAAGDFQLQDEKEGNLSLRLQQSGNDKQTQANVDLTLKTKGEQAITLNMKGAVFYDVKGDMYLKASNLEDVYRAIVAESMKSMAGSTEEQAALAQGLIDSMFKPLIDKLDNRWIKISAKDLQQADTNDEAACVQKALEKIGNSQTMKDEVANAFNDNRFAVVKDELGLSDNSQGYSLAYDQAKAKDFQTALAATSAGAELNKCGNNSPVKNLEKNLTEAKKSLDEYDKDWRLEVWIDRWTHQVTSVNYKADNTEEKHSASLNYRPEFNVPVSLSAPEDFITLDELQKEIETLMGGMFDPSAFSSGSEL